MAARADFKGVRTSCIRITDVCNLIRTQASLRVFKKDSSLHFGTLFKKGKKKRKKKKENVDMPKGNLLPLLSRSHVRCLLIRPSPMPLPAHHHHHHPRFSSGVCHGPPARARNVVLRPPETQCEFVSPSRLLGRLVSEKAKKKEACCVCIVVLMQGGTETKKGPQRKR